MSMWISRIIEFREDLKGDLVRRSGWNDSHTRNRISHVVRQFAANLRAAVLSNRPACNPGHGRFDTVPGPCKPHLRADFQCHVGLQTDTFA